MVGWIWMDGMQISTSEWRSLLCKERIKNRQSIFVEEAGVHCSQSMRRVEKGSPDVNETEETCRMPVLESKVLDAIWEVTWVKRYFNQELHAHFSDKHSTPLKKDGLAQWDRASSRAPRSIRQNTQHQISPRLHVSEKLECPHTSKDKNFFLS